MLREKRVLCGTVYEIGTSNSTEAPQGAAGGVACEHQATLAAVQAGLGVRGVHLFPRPE